MKDNFFINQLSKLRILSSVGAFTPLARELRGEVRIEHSRTSSKEREDGEILRYAE